MGTTLTKPVLLDETGQTIVNKLDDIKEAIGTTGEFIPLAIKVTTPPTKTAYLSGEALDLAGIVVKIIGTTGAEIDVTSACTFSPANGATLTSSDTSVTITYHWAKDNIDFTTSQALTAASITSIQVTTPPTKTNYSKGEQLDLAGIVVTANTSGGGQVDVTSQCIFSPSDGSTLSTLGDISVTITYSYGGQTFTASQTISVTVKIVSWANGTDAEIIEMLTAHYDGDIDIHDYWAVGDERTVHLSAMAATGVGETHDATDVTFVLMNSGGKTLSDGTTECAFVVGQKEALGPGGYINPSLYSNDNWGACARRTWCNSVYYNAIPSSIRSIFKEFIYQYGAGHGSASGVNNGTDYFTFPAYEEITGQTGSAFSGEGSQFKYYETEANRIKAATDTQGNADWWTRSPVRQQQNYFIVMYGDTGAAGSRTSNSSFYLSPYGCI